MHALALRFSWDNAASSAPRVPRLLLILVFVVELGRRLLNWILSPLHRTGILEEARQYPSHNPLPLWPIVRFTTTIPHISSSCPVNSPLQTIRENLPAVVEYGSLLADRRKHITCAVCLTDFRATDRIRCLPKCGHIFHMECLDKWIDYQRYSCPLCRSPTLYSSIGEGQYQLL